jgi:hypothetical protein
MKYLLIVFVIFLALAPLSHFVPSKRQRKVARLREYAAVHGLFVEFRHLPGSSREGSPARGAGQQIIYYGKRLPPARHGQGAPHAAWLYDEQGWHGITDGARAVPAIVEQLPPAMLAASVDDASCGIYWREDGDEELVEKIRVDLEAWAAEIRG